MILSVTNPKSDTFQQGKEPDCIHLVKTSPTVLQSVTQSNNKEEALPGDSDVKESACSAGDLGSTPGSGRSLGEGRGYPLQDS